MQITIKDITKVNDALINYNSTILTNSITFYNEMLDFLKELPTDTYTDSNIRTIKHKSGTLIFLPKVEQYLLVGRSINLIVMKKDTIGLERNLMEELKRTHTNIELIEIY